MNKPKLICLMAFAAISCTELANVEIQKAEKTFLVVESFLTDMPGEEQTVLLSESIGYLDETEAPAVRGAEVSVNDDSETVVYEEDPSRPGLYVAPKGFCGKAGKTYRLHIRARINGDDNEYEAESTMPEPGFQIDSINYSYMGALMPMMDSLWTVSVWGRDMPQTSWFYITGDVNGHRLPYELSSAMDDIYFAGQEIKSFPLTVLSQTAHNRNRYGECSKYLETGDVITLSALTLPKDCYEFFMSLSSNSTAGMSIPMLSTQPANCTTNIKGGPALGYFAACPCISASVTVTDPFRYSNENKI